MAFFLMLVGNIEQMLGETVRRHAREQHSANPKVVPRALAFRDERIGCLLNTVVEEGTLLPNVPGQHFTRNRIALIAEELLEQFKLSWH
jgi:hypothetical protein